MAPGSSRASRGVRVKARTPPCGAIFNSKSRKLHPTKRVKIDAEKVSKMNAKTSQNYAKMDTEIIDFSNVFEKGKNTRNYCIYNIKRSFRYASSHHKSIKNPCKLRAEKQMAKLMNIMPKWSQNGSPNDLEQDFEEVGF